VSNTIAGTPGLALLVASADRVDVRDNVISGANARAFSAAACPAGARVAQGSIFALDAAHVTFEGNQRKDATTEGLVVASDCASCVGQTY
jgi:hypothetical protein